MVHVAHMILAYSNYSDYAMILYGGNSRNSSGSRKGTAHSASNSSTRLDQSVFFDHSGSLR